MSAARLRTVIDKLANQLIGMPSRARRAQLRVLRRWDPRVYAGVVDSLRQMRELALRSSS